MPCPTKYELSSLGHAPSKALYDQVLPGPVAMPMPTLFEAETARPPAANVYSIKPAHALSSRERTRLRPWR